MLTTFPAFKTVSSGPSVKVGVVEIVEHCVAFPSPQHEPNTNLTNFLFSAKLKRTNYHQALSYFDKKIKAFKISYDKT